MNNNSSSIRFYYFTNIIMEAELIVRFGKYKGQSITKLAARVKYLITYLFCFSIFDYLMFPDITKIYAWATHKTTKFIIIIKTLMESFNV